MAFITCHIKCHRAIHTAITLRHFKKDAQTALLLARKWYLAIFYEHFSKMKHLIGLLYFLTFYFPLADQLRTAFKF